MTKKKILIISLLVTVILIVGAIISEPRTHIIDRFFDNIADNRSHYLSCDQLPTIEEVNKTLQAHKDVLEKIIKEVGSRYRDGEIKVTWEFNDNGGIALEGDKNGSYFGVYWGEPYPNCQNTVKSDILFDYLSHSDREIIEKTLGTTFFGIPYRGENH